MADASDICPLPLLPKRDYASLLLKDLNMPSDLSTWFIAVPNDSDAEGLLPQLRQKLEAARALPRSSIGDLAVPQLKVRCLRYNVHYLIFNYTSSLCNPIATITSTYNFRMDGFEWIPK